MNKGDIITIYVDERKQTNPIGEFKLLEKLNLGNCESFEYWLAENINTGRQDKYLIRNRNQL